MPSRLSIAHPDRTLSVVFPFSRGPRISRHEFSDYSGNGILLLKYEQAANRKLLDTISFRLEGWHFDLSDAYLCEKVKEAFERELGHELRHSPQVEAVTLNR